MPGLPPAVALALRGRGIAPKTERINPFGKSRFAPSSAATRIQTTESRASILSNTHAAGRSERARDVVCFGRYHYAERKGAGRRHACCAGFDEDGGEGRP